MSLSSPDEKYERKGKGIYSEDVKLQEGNTEHYNMIKEQFLAEQKRKKKKSDSSLIILIVIAIIVILLCIFS